jgi:glyoxylase-like metal-dependent hydrolase (beta-lactamase superfamily II)
MEETYTAVADIRVLQYNEPAGPLGFLPMNAFLIKAEEPILIDSSVPWVEEGFLEALWSEIDPEDLRWIFVTHEDGDHCGNLAVVLERAPNARVVLSFLGMLKIGPLVASIPERLCIVNAGQGFDAGDRRFRVIRPPLFDSGASIGFFDERTRVLFAADSFGGLIPRPTTDVNEVADEFRDGFVVFNHANTAWIGLVDEDKFAAHLDRGVRSLAPEVILSTHAPALVGMTDSLVEQTAALPSIEPIELPDDAAFREMLREMKAGERPAAAQAAGEAA